MHRILCLIMTLIMTFALVACGSDTNINESDSLETKAGKVVLKEVSKAENVLEVKLTEDVINNGKIVRLNLNGNDSGRLTLLDKSKNILQGLFSLDEISEVQLIWNANLVDQYGKVENMPVLKIMLKRATAEKIGWDMFDINQFENISDSYWQHKAFEK
jgi:hypothetical protein